MENFHESINTTLFDVYCKKPKFAQVISFPSHTLMTNQKHIKILLTMDEQQENALNLQGVYRVCTLISNHQLDFTCSTQLGLVKGSILQNRGWFGKKAPLWKGMKCMPLKTLKRCFPCKKRVQGFKIVQSKEFLVP